MSKTPRKAYVVRDRPTRLHVPTRQLPIVFVPGIMGSRLSDPKTGEPIWNPTGSPIGDDPGSFCVDFERLIHQADLMPSSVFENSDVTGVRHLNGIVGDFYRRMVFRLAGIQPKSERQQRREEKAAKERRRAEHEGKAPKTQPTGTKPPDVEPLLEGLRTKVYCAGYDWRGDAARAAFDVARVVDEALADTGEKQVIIVAHSMGGLVSRYFCRVLGGEAKVFRLFLVGSPTLGAPTAYQQVKTGITGFYLKEFADNIKRGDTDAAIGEVLSATSHLPKVIQVVGQGYEHASEGTNMLINRSSAEQHTQSANWFKSGLASGAEGAKAFLGDIYLAVSIGSGRLLTRRETTYMARTITGLFQMCPNAIFCRENPYWVFFDPFATGLPATGHMIILPSVAELTAGLVGHGAKIFGDSASAKTLDAVDAFFSRDEKENRNSKRATRNITVIGDKLKELSTAWDAVKDLGAGLKDFGQAIACAVTDEGRRWESFKDEMSDAGDDFSDMIDNATAAAETFTELQFRFDSLFLDGRNVRQLYSDIYTGMLDVVELRGVAAANLAMTHRFHDSLTVNPAEVPPKTAGGIIGGYLSGALDLLGAGAEDLLLSVDWFTDSILESREEAANEAVDEAAAEALAEENKPRVYMHPRTVNIFCDTQYTVPGVTLIPRGFISNDDSNIVSQDMMIHAPLIGAIDPTFDKSIIKRSMFGDDSVPALSANPDPEWMSNPFLSIHRVLGVSHGPMANADDVIEIVMNEIRSAAAEFLRQ